MQPAVAAAVEDLAIEADYGRVRWATVPSPRHQFQRGYHVGSVLPRSSVRKKGYSDSAALAASTNAREVRSEWFGYEYRYPSVFPAGSA